MKPITVCSMVFNRHDLLRKQMLSLRSSTVMPAAICIVDHGYDTRKIQHAVRKTVDVPIEIVTLDDPGVAHAGNWFFTHVAEERVLVCDDVQFFPETLERMAMTPGDFISPTYQGQVAGYPLFLIRDSCLETVGSMDEAISPGYLYFEDWDYTHRMHLAGIGITSVEAGYHHEQKGSISAYTPSQMAEHHRKFRIAQDNYYRKWPELRPKEFARA